MTRFLTEIPYEIQLILRVSNFAIFAGFFSPRFEKKVPAKLKFPEKFFSAEIYSTGEIINTKLTCRSSLVDAIYLMPRAHVSGYF